jgi:signal transduction histidine kinase
VAGAILDPYRNLHATGNNGPEILAQVVLWRQIVLLLIPLVVVSWQYTMRQVVLFCVLTAVLNIALLSQTGTFQEMISSSLLGIVATQAVIFLLVGHMIVNLMKVQREQRQRLTEANERLAQHASTLEQLTISRERNRLARELHDVLAHTLSGVAVELEGLRAMLRIDPERANTLLSHSLQAIREGLTESRRALKDLRAKPLEDLGLVLAVRALAESYTSRFGFRVDLDIDPDLGNYPDEVQHCVYRIAQEALANIAEHARAQNVQVILKRDRDQLQLIIHDDGCGFDGNGVRISHLSFPTEKHHYGLLGMRERVEMIGGRLAVESQVRQGTQVCFSYGGDQ